MAFGRQQHDVLDLCVCHGYWIFLEYYISVTIKYHAKRRKVKKDPGSFT